MNPPNSPAAEFDPYAPYGPVVETTVRIATWNVWGRFGDVDERQRLIDQVLTGYGPDVVALTESWATGETNQARHVAGVLGHEHQHHFGSLPEDDGWASGIGVVSRWPIERSEQHDLLDPGGQVRGLMGFARISGPRGDIDLFTLMLDYPLSAGAVRRHQVQAAAQLVARLTSRRNPSIVCGDFNAGPTSDEIRMLTGQTTPATEGLVFYDAWEVAGDGGPGTTFARDNPLAAMNLFPDRRFDYIFSAWPRKGGRGHPVACHVIGKDPVASDHYGVMADLRY